MYWPLLARPSGLGARRAPHLISLSHCALAFQSPDRHRSLSSRRSQYILHTKVQRDNAAITVLKIHQTETWLHSPPLIKMLADNHSPQQFIHETRSLSDGWKEFSAPEPKIVSELLI